MKRLVSAALSAALLISISACVPGESAESGPVSSGGVSASSSPAPGATGSPENSAVPVSPPPEYDEDHRLNEEIPALIDGLEMPVIGSTGYTTVELPLWPFNPNDVPEPDPTESAPPPVSSPDVPPEPDPSEPSPDESGEPEPPSPEESEPLPSQFVDIGPEPDTSEEPGYSEEPGASEEPSAEPEPEPSEESDPYPGALAVWEAGRAFLILDEDGDWWYVSRGGETGWIEHRYCMINLPDVIPSIIYNDTNAYASVFTAANGKEIPNITGKALYESMDSNYRLDRQEFVMPILYSAARNICAAQHRALAEGNCLVVYQTFRPYDTQIKVASAMSALARTDAEVKAGISTPPWSIDWFIATGISNHQRGYALDASMVKVYATETKYVGAYPYLRVTDFEDYQMPTPMHELSYAAAATTGPSNYTQRSATMNGPAIALQKYFTSSGLSLLPSEWWHFNDNAAMRATADKPSDGRYFTSECLSCPPEWVSGLLIG